MGNVCPLEHSTSRLHEAVEDLLGGSNQDPGIAEIEVVGLVGVVCDMSAWGSDVDAARSLLGAGESAAWADVYVSLARAHHKE